MILIDTSVLVYAVGSEHPLRAPCRWLMEQHAGGRLEVATTAETLHEFAYVRARRTSRAEAARVAQDWADALVLVPVGTREVALGLQLFAGHSIGSFDAMLAATALSHEMDALVSADGGFASVGELLWLDPAAADFERGVAALGGG